MTTLATEQFSTEWSDVLQRFPATVSTRVGELAALHCDQLASHFYEQMLTEPAANAFLTHEEVQVRLHASMQRWIARVFSGQKDMDLDGIVAEQIHVGDVHARIDIPVHLVLRGARLLKVRFIGLIRDDAQLDGELFDDAARLVSEVMDLSMEIMSQSYTRSNERNVRAEEAYRLFSVAQNISSERERQRAALLNWENQLMFDHLTGDAAGPLPRVVNSEFSLWFRHKGAHAFQGATETQQILEALDRIDSELLPELESRSQAEREQRVECLRRLRDQMRVITYHLERLFEQNSELEAGRDVLTRLLNRKYLGTVLSRQVNYCRTHDANFALLVIDVDQFKAINDRYGHDGGDVVLQQLAVILNNSIRSGDYLFRLGGEEFLVVLVDVDAESAVKTADKIRRRVATEVLHLPPDQRLQVTTSVGVALHEGHPDYQHTLKRADQALYEAKHRGRNCVVLAGQPSG